MGIVGGIVGVNGAKTRAHVISLLEYCIPPGIFWYGFGNSTCVEFNNGNNIREVQQQQQRIHHNYNNNCQRAR